MKDLLKIWLTDKVQLSIWFVFFITITFIWVKLFTFKAVTDFSGQNNIYILKFFALSASLNLALIFSFLRHYIKNNLTKHEKGLIFSKENGCWHSPGKEQYFCPSCISERRAPLQYRDPDYYLKCNVCGKGFTGPDYHGKKRKIISSGI